MAENPENNATTIGVVKESVPGETRVGLIPDSVKHLVGKGLQVVVQAGAGEGSSISDAEYEDAGARIVPSFADVHDAADVVVRVQAPAPDRGELEGLKRDQVLVSYLAPLVNHDLNRQIAATGVTAMAMDAVPRITRAQSMDSLSAMSTISGYKAVLMAAETLPKFFPLLMTAAGTIRPARVLVLGAGVAGLQAIATARRLGAVVEAYDVRAVVKEQVQSLGAKFVEIDTGAGNAEAAGGYAREATPEELKKQQEGLNDHIANSDVVITTALVPGRPAPKMIPASAVERMRTGSVIVDLAAETGGNCELTTPGEVTKEHGVTIFGTLNLPATLPVHASQMYGKVVTNFLDLLIKDGQVNLNFDDEIISSMAITHQGEIAQAQTRKMMGLDEAAPAAAPEPSTEADEPAADATDTMPEADTETHPVESDEQPAYRPFADDDDSAADSADADETVQKDSVQEEAAATYIPFSSESPLNDATEADSAVTDPATEIVSYSAADDDGSSGEYVTADEVADDAAITDSQMGESAGSSESDSDSFNWTYSDSVAGDDETRASGESEVTDALVADDGSETSSVDSTFDVDDESAGLATDDGSEIGDVQSASASEPGDAQTSSFFSPSMPEVDHVDRYDAETGEKKVDAGKLASYLSEEYAEAPGESDGDSESKSLPDARKNSKLPLTGEGTDWVAGDGSADIPDGFPIKGNANSGIYHPQESPSYSETVAEIYFASGALAEQHGYRLPKMLQKAADKDAAARVDDSALHNAASDSSVVYVEEESDENE